MVIISDCPFLLSFRHSYLNMHVTQTSTNRNRQVKVESHKRKLQQGKENDPEQKL